MFTSIDQVNEEFFKLFFNYPLVIDGEAQVVHFRYAKKSGFDYVEEDDNQIYPCIVIQDYSPELRDSWFVDLKKYLGEFSEDGLKAYLYQRPIWMDFRYDVSICAKNYFEYKALQQSFLRQFQTQGRLILDKTDLGVNGEVGEVVPFKVIATDIPRGDGVSETNYEFSLAVWLAPTTKEEVDVVTSIILNIEEAPLEEEEPSL